MTSLADTGVKNNANGDSTTAGVTPSYDFATAALTLSLPHREHNLNITSLHNKTF